MKCRLLLDMNCTPDAEWPSGIKPAGTVIDHPDAFRLVQIGCAESADTECDVATQRTPEQLARARYAYVRVSRGIHPDDYEAYDAGVMTGYRPDGSFEPGPNYVEEDDEESEEESGDDEE